MKHTIYQLHIPRTSGVFIRSALRSYSENNNKSILAGHNFNINLEDFKVQDYIIGHYGLTPIPYASKTFTILRDPVERCFSYMKYVWQAFYRNLNIDEVFEKFLNDEDFKNILSNQQSKFLTSFMDIKSYNENTNNIKNHFLSGWSLIVPQINKDSVINSINNNNIEVLFFDDERLYKKVFDIFGINNISQIDYYKKTNQSVELDLNFYNKHYDKIVEINQIDIEFYNHLRSV
jgi:hypothetical protein